MIHRCLRLTVPVACLALTASVTAQDTALTPAERAAGWTVLFDGTSTDAWRGYRRAGFPESGWAIEGNTLHAVGGGGGGDLITKQQFENFELTLEWKAGPSANSGIMYRVTEEYGASWMSGPEMQILDDEGYGVEPLGGHAAGALYDLYTPSPDKVSRPAGEWNQVRILVRDGRLRQELNGVALADVDLNSDAWRERVANSKFNAYDGFGSNEVGHIALQEHGDDVWFRNVRIRDLDAPMPGEIDLLAGNRMDQLTAHLQNDGKMEDVWRFEEDVLICAGRPIGYIRTNADYTNYVLRFQWRFDPEKGAGNSGALLRMIGEDKVWPRSVEAQLQSGAAGDFWNIDKFVMTAAEDRTNGRNTKRVGGSELPLGEWNDYEIIVDGTDVTLIVNGDVVNTAWDVDEIPGKICFQSEGAEIHFRRMRVAEIR